MLSRYTEGFLMTNKRTNWYKNAVVYQIYPRSFCDGNNDGLGDIPILFQTRLFRTIRVNCVWLSPIRFPTKRQWI